MNTQPQPIRIKKRDSKDVRRPVERCAGDLRVLCAEGTEVTMTAIHDELFAGELPPRPGDFVRSRLDPFVCGFVVDLTTMFTVNLPVVNIRVANGSVVAVGLADVEFIAPYEWDE